MILDTLTYTATVRNRLPMKPGTGTPVDCNTETGRFKLKDSFKQSLWIVGLIHFII